jgi:hypothetical protein
MCVIVKNLPSMFKVFFKNLCVHMMAWALVDACKKGVLDPIKEVQG